MLLGLHCTAPAPHCSKTLPSSPLCTEYGSCTGDVSIVSKEECSLFISASACRPATHSCDAAYRGTRGMQVNRNSSSHLLSRMTDGAMSTPDDPLGGEESPPRVCCSTPVPARGEHPSRMHVPGQHALDHLCSERVWSLTLPRPCRPRRRPRHQTRPRRELCARPPWISPAEPRLPQSARGTARHER